MMVFFQSFNLFAQLNIDQKVTKVEYTSDWVIYQSMELVNIYYKYSDCSDAANGFYPEYVLFKVENKTNEQVYVYWNYSVSINNEIVENSSHENLVQVFLAPNEIKEGECKNVWENKLGVIVGDKKSGKELSGFNLNDIKEFKLNK